MTKSQLLRRLVLCRVILATGILVSSCGLSPPPGSKSTPGAAMVGGGGAGEAPSDALVPGAELRVAPIDGA